LRSALTSPTIVTDRCPRFLAACFSNHSLCRFSLVIPFRYPAIATSPSVPSLALLVVVRRGDAGINELVVPGARGLLKAGLWFFTDDFFPALAAEGADELLSEMAVPDIGSGFLAALAPGGPTHFSSLRCQGSGRAIAGSSLHLD